MKTIFESAQKTLIWLGEEDEDTPVVMDCINRIPTLPRAPMESREVPESSLAIVKDMLAQEIRGPKSPAYQKRVAMGRLLNRGWFERAWVFQEAAVSSHVAVQIGSYEFDFVHFCAAVRAFCDVEQEKWRSFGRSLPMATRGYNTLEVVEYGRRVLAERSSSSENSNDPQSSQEKNASFVALMLRLAGLVQATDPATWSIPSWAFKTLQVQSLSRITLCLCRRSTLTQQDPSSKRRKVLMFLALLLLQNGPWACHHGRQIGHNDRLKEYHFTDQMSQAPSELVRPLHISGY